MTEPRITVTKEDRRAAFNGYYGGAVLPGQRDYDWIVGTVERDEKHPLSRISLDRARARAMAAFDERVSCAFKLAQVCDEIQLSVVVGVAVDADQGPDMLTRDDIRALVLAGWEGTT